jgi:Na+-transporting methylmalonyl-CoA/oxaloacetate decarboxylase gamma subunit
MNSFGTLAQALGIAYTTGINLYATVAIVGLAERLGWIGPLPGGLSIVANPFIIGLATVLYLLEFLATLIPGVASAWETFSSLIRPPAAAALAAATAWHGDAVLVLAAALLGGSLAVVTHTTKLGLRYAIDTSPEPLTNGASNIAELGLVATVSLLIWQHPWATLGFALGILVLLIFAVRLIWRALVKVFSGHWMPGRGLLQDARCSAAHPPARLPKED